MSANPTISESRVVHRIHLGDARSAEKTSWLASDRIGFPGWETRWWGEDDLPTLAPNCLCGELLLNRDLDAVFRTGILRYELLRHLGGAVVSEHVEMCKPLDEIMVEDCIHAGLLEGTMLGIDLLVSPAKHPFWEFLLRRIRALAQHGAMGGSERLTGSAALTQACQLWLADQWMARSIEVNGRSIGGILEHGDWVLWNPEILPAVSPGRGKEAERRQAYGINHQPCPTPDEPPKLPVCPKVRIFTFSFQRPSYICSLIAAMKAQTCGDFIHHIHLLNYSRDEVEFIQSMIHNDPRFVVSEHQNLKMKENLMRMLENLPQDADYFLKLDDDDIYIPTFLEAILQVAHENQSDLTCFNTQLRYEVQSRKVELKAAFGLYGNTMCISRSGLRHLLLRPVWEAHSNADGWIDAALKIGGFRRCIHSSPQPYVLYLRHGANVS